MGDEMSQVHSSPRCARPAAESTAEQPSPTVSTPFRPVPGSPIIYPTTGGRRLVPPRRATPSTRRHRASLPPLLTFSKPEDYRKPRQPLSPNSDGELMERRIEASEPTCSDRTRKLREGSARTRVRDLNICGAHCLARLLTLIFRLAKEPNLRGF